MMTKKIIAIILVLMIVVIGGGWWFMGAKTSRDVSIVEQTTLKSNSQVSIEMGKLWLDLGSKPTSMVSITLGVKGSKIIENFVTNKAIFNSEMQNKIDQGKLKLTLGVMKSTVELPQGRILLGEIKTSGNGGVVLESGAVTFAGQNGESPSEIKLVSGPIEESI